MSLVGRVAGVGPDPPTPDRGPVGDVGKCISSGRSTAVCMGDHVQVDQWAGWTPVSQRRGCRCRWKLVTFRLAFHRVGSVNYPERHVIDAFLTVRTFVCWSMTSLLLCGVPGLPAWSVLISMACGIFR